jgi:protein-S-isoprenylcysteine O-methyltransferase Ste14
MDRTFIRFVGAAMVAALAFAATSLGQSIHVVLGIVVGLPSFVLMIVSRRQLGESFSIMPDAKALVTTGLYSKLQHPMYVFLDLFLVGVIIVLDLPILLWAWGILVVVQTLQSRKEEKVLAAAFGDKFEAYKANVWL